MADARVVVLAKFRLPREHMAEARGLMPALIAATQAEDGCLAYHVGEDVTDPGMLRVSELWASRDHLTAHLATAHMATWGAQRARMGMTERAVTIFNVSGEAVL